MSTKSLFSGGTLVEIEPRRYDELVAKEERLRLLEKAIADKKNYDSISDIKTIFNLEKEDEKNEED